MWYQKSVETTIKELKTDATDGLAHKEAALRLSKYGRNILPEKQKPPLFFKFISQFKNTLVLILLLATIVSFFLGDILDAAAIFAIVILNSTIGFIQEIQAEKTLESLKQKEVLYAIVARGGQVERIPVTDVVRGDLLVLEEGEKIPADCRIIESFSLRVDESILTGESSPAAKNPKELNAAAPLGDRTNMVYKDTQIVAGRGKAVVVETGKDTEMGKIAAFLEEAKTEKTSLTVELEKVGRTLTAVIGVIAGIIFLINFLGETPLVESLLVSISLAVAAIPEGLPAIVTIVLSLGVKRLADKKTIVKKLPSVETLGAVRIIASDKTGTLTQNKINAVKIILSDGQEFLIEGQGYQKEGIFFDRDKKIFDPLKLAKLELFLRAAILGSNAAVSPIREIIGDTTEGALIVAGERANLKIDEIRFAEPKIYEVPFSAERKMMSTVVKVNETKDHFLYGKGAPEVMIPKCHLSKVDQEKWLTLSRKLAAEGLRNLVIARKKIALSEVKKALEEDILEEDGFTFLGIIGMQDSLRPEIIEALTSASQAGIKTIMITGDHKATAASIAIQAGIMKKGDIVLTEDEIARLSTAEIAKEIKKGAAVFARISPMGKLKIIKAIKSIPNMQVAVTGDGVNDAPALSAAHIGVAMGKTGTDITREVADLVITDDNYATIVDAVAEGRIIFANLIKFIRYLISCNLSEVIVVAAGVFLGTPLPLLPIQILWINLITDGLPALALGVDPPEFDVMRRPPRDLREGILHKKRWVYMMIEGSIMGISTFALFLFALYHFSYPVAQTMTFVALALSQLVHAFNNRSTRRSLFQLGIFSNKYLVGTVILSIILQFLTVETNWGNLVFKTTNLSSNQWLLVTMIGLVPFVVVEIKKQLRFRILP